MDRAALSPLLRYFERHLLVFIGVRPHTRWLADQLALDDNGFILTGADAAGPNGAGRSCSP